MPRPGPVAALHRARGLILACLLLAATEGTAGTGEAVRFAATYRLGFLGLPVGEATLTVAQGNGRYALDLNAALRGVAGFFVDGAGTASAAGERTRAGTVTGAFALDSRYAGKPIHVALQLEGGRVRSAVVEPPPTPRPDRVPVATEDKVGVVDPLSMLAIPLGAAPLEPGLCDRRIAVFDGATRADLVLSRGALVTVEEGAYRGAALECRVRWVPISGHRANGRNVRRMAENDEMQVRLAPALDGALLLPLSIAVATGWGTVRIEATAWGTAPPVAAERSGVRVRLPNAR